MFGDISGFSWDAGNWAKCQKHGVSIETIEALFMGGPLAVEPSLPGGSEETRFRAIGRTEDGRGVFMVFTIRERDGGRFIRPISARYMHKKEIDAYEKENPQLQD